MSWSLVDTARKRETGSANRSTERTNAESSMKAWIATDLVRVAGARGRALRASEKADIDAALRRSDDQAAERIYRSLGADQVLRDLKTVCGVAVPTPRRGYGRTPRSPRPTPRRSCAASSTGRRPTPAATSVTALRGVQPDNAFGIPQALPPGTVVAVKNGWTQHSRPGCGTSTAWRPGATTRSPCSRATRSARPLDYGAGVCRDVTAAVLARLP